MAEWEELAQATRKDAFMQLMRQWSIRGKLYDIYQAKGWPGIHDKLVQMLRVAERERVEDQETDEIARALEDVVRYLVKGYQLGQCTYISANPPPKGAHPDEIEGHELRGELFSREATVLPDDAPKLFLHYFLSTSAKRVPKWCPDHSLAARQRTHRQKRLKSRRSGKFI